MDAREKAIRQKLKDDLTHYANKCLKIRTKSGEILPFIFNEAQLYAHKLVEHQLALTGRVRAIICKGRQQGMCYSPDMRVLTSDYRWVEIKDIQIGDRIMAIDEKAIGHTINGRKSERRIRTATVEAKVRMMAPLYKVEFEDGSFVTCTAEHRHLCLKRSGTDTQWRAVRNCKPGDSIRSFCSTNDNNKNFEDGWFGGLLDGEGSFGASPAIRISLSQIDGPVLRRAKKYLKDNNIKYYELIDRRTSGTKSKLGEKPVHCLRIDRMTDVLTILTKTQPTRFINRELFVGKKLPKSCDGYNAWKTIINIIPLGESEVIDLQTSEKTFICEGIVSHNSTYIGGRFYWKITHRRGVKAFILTHDSEATTNLFDMTQRYHQYCPPLVRPQAANQSARELYFDGIDSGYKVGTAGNKAVGRSSTIQFLHGSEVAYWPNAPEHAKGVLQAVPPNIGTEIFLESTANGIGNYFHEQWQLAEAGQSDFIPIFVPWFWQSEYKRDVIEQFQPNESEIELIRLYRLKYDQLLWRRYKIQELSAAGGDGEHAFHREYPNNAIEAFAMSGEDTLIHPDLVMHARKNENLEGIGPLIVGCDPARFGGDRTSIIYRKGRKAYNLRSYIGKDTMEVAGIIHKIITTDYPEMVCIDVGGLGAGVVDRLFELGHKGVVIPINSGESSLDSDRYVNKRAELWGNTKEWLMMKPVEIPDSDSLHADLCSVKYTYDSLNRLKIEPKEQMKKRGLRSPDEADALCLTHAIPFNAIQKNKNQSKSIANEFHAANLRRQKLRMDR